MKLLDRLHVSVSDTVADIVTVKGKIVLHRQIERKHGLMFMRLRKRTLP
ncbi:MAG: hypothetical protein ABIH34_06440 [Nanoarchaeota archaeon]